MILPCATPSESLIGPAFGDEAEPDHTRGCPYCQAELTRLRSDAARLRTAREAPLPGTERLQRRVITRLRAEFAAGTGSVLLPGDRGTLRIGSRPLVLLATLAAGRVPGVRIHSGSFDDRGLRLEIQLPYGREFAAAARDITAAVRNELRERAGVDGITIDIHLQDVW